MCASGTRAVKQSDTATTFYAGDLYQTTERTGSVTQRYMVYAGGRAVAQVTQTDTDSTTGEPLVSFLHDDALGSIQAVTSPDGHAMTARSFGTFGVADQPFSTTDVPYGYTGQEEDAELGLINMHGRMYDPVLGQFLSPDPVMQGTNRFAYAFNSPLNYVDPSGFSAVGDFGDFIVNGATQQTSEYADFGGSSISGFGAETAGTGVAESGGGLGLGSALGIGGSALALANGIAQNIALSSFTPVTSTSTVTATKTSNGSRGGPPAYNRTGGQNMASSPVTERGKDPLSDRSRFAGTEYDIARKLPRGPRGELDPEGAIAIANRFWNVNRVQTSYDNVLPNYAITTYYHESGALTGTYGTKSLSSAQTLLSTAYHEGVIHVGQARTGNYAREGTKGSAVNEIEAYDAEFRQSARIGLSQDEIREIQQNRQAYYDELFGTSYQAHVDRGDFSVGQGDLAK